MYLRKVGLFALLTLLAAVLFSAAVAQTNQGSIAGVVTDPSGAVVPNAKITAKDTSRGTTYETVSSSAGTYRFSNLNIGTYDVTASAAGFKTTTLTGVPVQVATTAALDIHFQTGTVTENVTVNADIPTVQTESSDIGTVVSTKQVLDLPLPLGSTVQAMRSPEAFAFLSPGVVGPGSDSGNGGTFESKITGGQNYATEVLLDGASTTRSENGSSFDETAPSVEALGEFKVLTSTLPAEFGRTTGGIETFNTKSGTNNYHGNVYELFRNTALDANVWGNDYCLQHNDPLICGQPRSTYATPLDRQNDYGLTMGGPVRIPHIYDGRSKTFFFFSWEQYRQTAGGVSTSTVPTNAMRNGDFSALLGPGLVDAANGNSPIINPCTGQQILQGQIFDPSTTRVVNGITCRDPYPGNMLTPSSTVGQNILSYYPTTPSTAITNNYNYSYNFPIEDTTTTFRIDQNISQQSKAYFTYSSRENTRTSTTPVWNTPSGLGRNQFFGTHYIRFGYDYTISPTMLNHLNVGYNRTNSKNVGAGVAAGKDWAAALGITGGPSGPMFPAINQNNLSGMGDAVDGDTIDNGFRFSDTLTWIKGKHELKFGYEQWYQQYSPLNFQNTSGTYGFANTETSTYGYDPAAISASNPTGQQDVRGFTGYSLASTLVGQIDNANYTIYQSQARWLRSYFAGFVEDSFKVTPTLTLNYGLRYEVDEPFKEAQNNSSNISFSVPNCNSFTPSCPTDPSLMGGLAFAGTGPGKNGVANERWAETYKKDIGPRFGFAWSPHFLGEGKTVIRGGYGILYGGLQYADFGGYSRQGFQGTAGISSPDGFTAAYNLDSAFPVPKPALPNLDPSQVNFLGCCAETYVKPSYGRPPMIQNWSFEVQRELARDLILDVAYVGQHSTRLRSNYDGENLLNPQYFSLGALLNTPLNQQSTIQAPYPNFPGGFTVAQALVPHPQFFFLNTDGQLENLGQSTYNALQAQLSRRFHNGLNLMASYTFSKTLTNADAALPFFATLHQGGAPQNFYNRNGDKAISNQDLPHNFVVSYLYELPFGKGKHFLGNSNGVLDRVVGGWQIGGIQRYESGQPIAFGCATAPSAYTECIRFDQIQGTSALSSAFTSGHWDPVHDSVFNSINLPNAINPAAFVDPNAFSTVSSRGSFVFGTMPRVTGYRMRPYLDEDFSLIKRTKITETKALNFQVTAINAFNRHIWNRPEDLNPYDSLVSAQNPLPSFGLMQATNFSRTGGGSYLLAPRVLQLQLKFEY
jgi:Carboxypeptidase regulatory-like domain